MFPSPSHTHTNTHTHTHTHTLSLSLSLHSLSLSLSPQRGERGNNKPYENSLHKKEYKSGTSGTNLQWIRARYIRSWSPQWRQHYEHRKQTKQARVRRGPSYSIAINEGDARLGEGYSVSHCSTRLELSWREGGTLGTGAGWATTRHQRPLRTASGRAVRAGVDQEEVIFATFNLRDLRDYSHIAQRKRTY